MPPQTFAFFDGQNFLRALQSTWSIHDYDCDVARLAAGICRRADWELAHITFYTGVPSARMDSYERLKLNRYLQSLGSRGVEIHTTSLRYLEVPGSKPREKGIDVGIALDAVEAACEKNADVILLFSQDYDFKALIPAIQAISRRRRSPIIFATSYPIGSQFRGINGTRQLPFSRDELEASSL